MDDEKDGSSSALERFNEKIREADRGEPDDDERGPVVTTGKPEDVDDDKPAPVQTRRDRKNDRLKLKEAFDEAQRTNTELSERLARLEGAQSVMTARSGAVDKTDAMSPADEELDRLQDAHHKAYKEFVDKERSGNLTQADRDSFQKKVRQIEAQKIDTQVKRVLEERNIQPYNPKAALHAVLLAENADVHGDPRAEKYARSYFDMQTALGHKDDKELYERSMDAAREQFKMRPKAGRPTDNQRRQYEGARGGATRGAGEGSEHIVMSRPLRIMARAKYPGLSEEAAYIKWGEVVGPGYLADIARSKKG